MPYTTVLFDLDHTLLDSDTSEAIAFEETMNEAGVENPADHFPAYHRINRELWADVEAGRIGPDEVRHKRFNRFVREREINADPVAMAERYVQSLGAEGALYEGAAAMLNAVGAYATLALVTNGIGRVQRARIARLDLERHFDAIVISAEVGVSKPATRIFEVVFAELGNPTKESVLMIGDSLTSDIQGGTNFGIATCWYNRKGVRRMNGIAPTYEISDLAEIAALTGPA